VNRADLTKQVLLYDQLAAAAKAKAAIARAELDMQAKAELETQGMAPTWRMKDVGTISLPISQETIYIADGNALMDWVAAREPVTAIDLVRCINPQYQRDLEQRLAISGNVVVDKETGEVVPGYGVRHGGLPMALRIVPSSEARAMAREYADGLLANFEASLTGEVAE
jgi:hypothetical protein